MNRFVSLSVAVCLTLPFIGWATGRIYNGIVFDIHCEAYLKRAADSNSVETARDQLDIALKYMEANDMTHGNTGIFIKSPSDDVAFWYKNLSESKAELDKVTPTTTQLERTNLLMKLRETLLDKTTHGESVTAPGNICVYPNNLAYFLLSVFSFLMILPIMFFMFLAFADTERFK